MALTGFAYPVLTVGLCMLLAAVIARGRWMPAEGKEGGRFETIDGLRGFLALGVFFTHVMGTHGYYADGRWYSTFSPVHMAMGQAGVSLFFMITGFLFWRRVLRDGKGFDTRAFFVSRIRRLVPMYLASVAMVLFVVGALSGFELREAPIVFLRELRTWLSFGFMATANLNGVKDAHIIDAVYWTLAYEWSFYLALPLLALFARGAAFRLLALAVVFFGLQAPIVLNFLAGAFAAIAVERGLLDGRLARPWLAPIPIAALALVLTRDEVYAPAGVALLFVFFLFVLDGNSLFGLLRTRAAQLLGTVSYSFYLLHCIVLFVFFRFADAFLPVAKMSAEQHWTVAILAALAATVLSAFTYRRIELPFLKSGTDLDLPYAGTLSRLLGNRGLTPISQSPISRT
jgi:peptidoglycan/LPS O-acetylase OafA/YrhL